MSKLLLFIGLFLFLSGCSSFYYGYPKNEWEALSAQQQEVVKKDYQKIVKEKNLIVHGDPVEEATDTFRTGNISRSYGQNP